MANLRYFDNLAHYPADIREFDHRQCFRLWSCGMLGPQVTSTSTVPSTGAGGHHTGNFHLSNNYSDATSPPRILNLERSVEYSKDIDPFFTLVGKDGTTITRGWLSDRCTAGNPKLVGGMFEMDSYARVRYRGGGSDHDITPRIGFSQGHATLDINTSGADFSNSASFTCSRSEQTWFAHTNAAWSILDFGPPVIEQGKRQRVNTGIRVDEWHTLGVWMNKTGDEVRYFIDGRCVHRVTGKENIPNKFTIPTFVEGTPLGDALGGGVALRGTGTITTNTPKLDVEWCVIRVFMERP